MSERCPKCDAPARNMPPDGDYRYDNRVLRSAVARAEAAEAEVERLKGVLRDGVRMAAAMNMTAGWVDSAKQILGGKS